MLGLGVGTVAAPGRVWRASSLSLGISQSLSRCHSAHIVVYMNIEHVNWNDEKNEWLKQTRGVSFERIASLVLQSDILDVIDNPNQARYPGQQMLVVEIDNYAYFVPFVEQGGRAFFKTIIPSRKATRTYLRKK